MSRCDRCGNAFRWCGCPSVESAPYYCDHCGRRGLPHMALSEPAVCAVCGETNIDLLTEAFGADQ